MSVPGNSKISERLAILAATLPAGTTTGGGTVTSSFFNIGLTAGNFFQRFLGLAISNQTNVWTAQIIKASVSAGTNATVLLAQTASGTNTPVIEFDINGNTQWLNDSTNTFLGIQLIGTAGSTNFAGVILGEDGRYDPASTWNNQTAATIPAIL